MKLFSPRMRSDYEYARYSEPHFSFLDRSARPEFARVRDLCEEWFSRYPRNHQKELRARIRSKNDSHFESAFFELYIHELLLRLRITPQVHSADIELGSPKRPDILCTDSDGQKFILEATCAREYSSEQAAAKARVDAVYDTINKMKSPNYFIGIRYHGSPDSSPPGRQLRKFIQTKLAGLDPSSFAETAKTGDLDQYPSWPFQHDGWNIEIIAIPKSDKYRGDTSARPLGALMPAEAIWRKDDQQLRKVLRDKAGRYGALQMPYIIAVNAQLMFLDRIAIMQALFGEEAYIFGNCGQEVGPRMYRRRNGLWTAGAKPTYTRVSGVLIAGNILPWTVAKSALHLYINPWAKNLSPDCILSVPHTILADNEFKTVAGLHPRDSFELQEGFPLDEDDHDLTESV